MFSDHKRLLFLIAFVIFLAMFFMVFPCSFGIRNPRELLGTYVVKHEYATEKIVLKKDGIFIHEVTVNGTSKVDIAEGLWKYDADDGYLIFDGNFMNVVDGLNKFIPDYAQQKSTGLTILPVDKIFGNIVISRGDNIGYKKIEEIK